MDQPTPAELLRRAMQPKSDQLNAEDLISGTRVITVTSVHVAESGEQPVSIHYDGENGRPYKPCKTMMKLISFGWGGDPLSWVGKSMRLYCKHDVKFGSDTVGGIRVSEMDNIPQAFTLSLMKSRGKKESYTVRPLKIDQPVRQQQSQPVSQPVQQPNPAGQPPANGPSQEEIDKYVASQKIELENAAKISMQEFSRVWTDTKFKPLLSAHKDTLKAKHFPDPVPQEQPASTARDPNALLAELNADSRNADEF